MLAPANEEGTRATILRWCKVVGETVLKDEPLVELETDKVTVEIPSPASGTLIEVLKAVNAEVSPDGGVGALAEAASRSRRTNDNLPRHPRRHRASAACRIGGDHAVGGDRLSPSVRRLMQEHSIAAGAIEAQDATAA